MSETDILHPYLNTSELTRDIMRAVANNLRGGAEQCMTVEEIVSMFTDGYNNVARVVTEIEDKVNTRMIMRQTRSQINKRTT